MRRELRHVCRGLRRRGGLRSIARPPVSADPRHRVDHHQTANLATEFVGREQPHRRTETYTDNCRCRGRQRAHNLSDGTRHPRYPVVTVVAPVGAAVSGHVDGHQRACQCQGNGVPGVSILGAAVQQHRLWWVGSPHDGAHVLAPDAHRAAGNGRLAGPSEVGVVCVIAQE